MELEGDVGEDTAGLFKIPGVPLKPELWAAGHMCVPRSRRLWRAWVVHLPWLKGVPDCPLSFLPFLCLYCVSEELKKKSIEGERWGGVMGWRLGTSSSIREALTLYSNLHV